MMNIKSLYYQQGEIANKRFGVMIESLYFLYLIYTNVIIIYGFEINNLGVLMLAGTAALILFSTQPVRIFESPTVTFTVLMTFYMFFVVGLAHNQFMMVLFDQLMTMVLTAIIFVFLVHRPGFFKRMIFLMYIIGVIAFANADTSEYGRLQGGGNLGNPNVFASWMAFACLGLAMWGFHARSLPEKIGTWGMMFYGLVIIGLTVSRGALLALIVALVVFLIIYAPRSSGPINIIITLILIGIGAGIFTQTPVFQSITESYSDRLDKESGREELWPAAIAQIRESPVLGYGNSGLKVATPTKVHSSHNPFLTLGLIAGVFPPLLLAVMYGLGALRMEKRYTLDGVFWLPAFFIYTFMMINFSNWYFPRPWAMLTLVAALEYRHLLSNPSELEEE
ncbi:O-antigen ligase family protein [bacterium]|nr:O-antigen ligase family protein [bacterium]